MCDVRLFRSAYNDFLAAEAMRKLPVNDESFINIVAYHLQQCVEKTLKAALECTGVTVPKTHLISNLIRMIDNNGAELKVTEWIDDHSEMLSSWEAEGRYDMNFVAEKRKIDRALTEIHEFLRVNGIQETLRPELRNQEIRESLLACLPENKRDCSEFELNCYYLMFKKKLLVPQTI